MNQGTPTPPNNTVLPPDCDAAQLAVIASQRPDLWAEIWHHPNSYEGLRSWISERIGEAAAEAVAAEAAAEREALDRTIVAAAPAAAAFAPQPAVEQAVVTGVPMPSQMYVSASQVATVDAESSETAASVRSNKRLWPIVVSAVAAAALLLAGTGVTLALTHTWPFSPTSGGNISAASQSVPTFADGIEKRWTVTKADLGGGELPFYMDWGPQANGFDEIQPDKRFPIPFVGGVLVALETGESEPEYGETVVMLEPEHGREAFRERFRSESVGVGCIASRDEQFAYCLVGESDGSVLLTFGVDGLATRTKVLGKYADLEVDAHGVSAAGESHAARFDRSGKLLWQKDLQLHSPTNGGSGHIFVDAVANNGWTLARVFPNGWKLFDEKGKELAGHQTLNVETHDQRMLQWLDCDAGVAGARLFLFGACSNVEVGSGVSVTEFDTDLALSWTTHPAFTEQGADFLEVKLANSLTLFYGGNETKLFDAATGEATFTWQDDEDAHLHNLLRVNDFQAVVEIYNPGAESAYDRFQNFSLELESGEGRINAFPGLSEMRQIAGNVLLSRKGAAYDLGTGVELWQAPVSESWSWKRASGTGFVETHWSPETNDYTVTYFAPADAAQPSGVQAASLPSFIPDCPGDTMLLGWMELEDGWIVVCGISPTEPRYVQYKSSAGETYTSLGGQNPAGDLAKQSVHWDASAQRFYADTSGGRTITLDYTTGTVTLRDNAGGNQVWQQERFIRYVFVPIGAEVRSVSDSAGRTGAFDVETPDDTAEDQVRYMIEVLERSYEGRSLVRSALPKLQQCTGSAGQYGDSITAMKQVRDNRAELLEALDAMPVDKIPEGAQLLADLREAISISHQANLEYVKWAEAANASGCASLSASGSQLADASQPPKARFAERWNKVVAPKYHVRTFDASFI